MSVTEDESLNHFEGVFTPAQEDGQGELYRPFRVYIFFLLFIMLPDFMLH